MTSKRCPYCRRNFTSSLGLHRHYSHKPTCKADREAYLDKLATEARGQRKTEKQPQASAARNKPKTSGAPSGNTGRDKTRHPRGDPTGFENFPEGGGVLQNNEDTPSLSPASQAGNVPANPNPHPNRPAQPPPSKGAKRHGYASIEVFPGAARVTRWEYVDDDVRESTPEEVQRHLRMFRLGEWLATQPLTDQARAEYFDIEQEEENSLWADLKEFHATVDALDSGPEWHEEVLNVKTNEGSESFTVQMRNPVDLVRYLIGLERLRAHIRYGPERHHTMTADGRKIRVYSEMWTGEWWWRIQELIEAGATIAPFILASDETHLTRFSGSKVAWPLYGSIGNIRKAIRRRPSERAMMLLGLIPVAQLEWISNEDERRKRRWELYHACVALILEPLKLAARDGVEMRCADGGVRRVFPLIAAHLGDWPEHCTVGSTHQTRCPACMAAFKHRGDWGPPSRLRTKCQTIDAIRAGCVATLNRLGLRPVIPYWHDHPWASGPASIVPDLLHQLWKGVYLDHLRVWWTRLLGKREVGRRGARRRNANARTTAKKMLKAGLRHMDKRYMGVPRYAGQQHFSSGLSALTQWTGNEAKAMARVFLAVIAGSKPQEAVRAARCMMDFLWRARKPQLDKDDLRQLRADLEEFHELKSVFVQEMAHTSKYRFNNIAKLHVLLHYMHWAQEMGTPDGYTTETPERLHREYVKINYLASNGVVPEPQMIVNLQRREAWQLLRAKYEREGLLATRKRRGRPEEEPIEDEWCDDDEEWEDESGDGKGDVDCDDCDDCDEDDRDAERELGAIAEDTGEALDQIRAKEVEVFQFEDELQIAKRPLHTQFDGTAITQRNFAQGLMATITNYVHRCDPNLAFYIGPRTKLRIWAQLSIHHHPLPFAPLVGRKVDVIRAHPALYHPRGHITRSAAFDTVLLEAYPDMIGLLRYRAARIRVIFQLPTFFHEVCPEIFVFVELFDPFEPEVSADHLLAVTRPTKRDGIRATAIVPIHAIRASCQLVPDYEKLNPRARISSASDLLSSAPEFFLNRYSSYYFFEIMDHWRRMMQ